jgi:toxin FitB
LADAALEGAVVFDTDAASHAQAGRLPEPVTARISGMRVCVTFVTVGEFYKGAEKRGWGERRRQALEAWLRRVVVLPYDAEVAKRWGQIVARGERTGRSVAANDAWIAACCMAHNLPLLTFNRRHFEGIEGLDLVPVM